MSDGAQLGISAQDALEVILGGVPEADVVHVTTTELATRIMTTTLDDTNSYGGCADWVAQQIVLAARRDPHVMTDGRDLYDWLKDGFDPDSKAYDILTGISGFQWGWAENAARTILELAEVANPALLTFNVSHDYE